MITIKCIIEIVLSISSVNIFDIPRFKGVVVVSENVDILYEFRTSYPSTNELHLIRLSDSHEIRVVDE